MSDSDTNTVPRTPEEPTPEQVLEHMQPCEPYSASDLQDAFEDVSRWTLKRRLDTLVEDGEIAKKKHAENRVTFYIPK